MISGDRAVTIEKQLAELLNVDIDERRDCLAGNIRTSGIRRTGFRFVRGTHGGHYVRDREGTDIRPPACPSVEIAARARRRPERLSDTTRRSRYGTTQASGRVC